LYDKLKQWVDLIAFGENNTTILTYEAGILVGVATSALISLVIALLA
jgi:hypothetical protein